MSEQTQTIIAEPMETLSGASVDKALLMSQFRDLKSKLEAADKGDMSMLGLPIEFETAPEDQRKKIIAERLADLINQLLEVQYALQSDQAAGPKGRKPAGEKAPKKPKVSSANDIKLVANNDLLDDL